MNQARMFVSLVVAAMLGFSVGRLSMPASSGFDPAQDLNPAHLVRLLGLSEAQAAGLEQISADHARSVSDACDAHCAARCRLASALQQENLAAAEVQPLIERMCASQKENELATLNHIFKIRDLLTPEQRKIFATTLGACLCETCGGQGDSRCSVTATTP